MGSRRSDRRVAHRDAGAREPKALRWTSDGQPHRHDRQLADHGLRLPLDRVVVGLLLNALFGWWWADPIAALVVVGLLVWEGWEAVHAERVDELLLILNLGAFVRSTDETELEHSAHLPVVARTITEVKPMATG